MTGSRLGGFERPQSPTIALTHQLLRYLLSGEVKPGDRIPAERTLAEQLGVGRTLVREAVKLLVLLGLLDQRQGDGTYLANSTSNLLPEIIGWGLMLGDRTVEDLMEARVHLEVTLAGLAAERRTPAQIGDLRAILDTMRAADTDLAAYIEADVAFHVAIAHSAGNTALADMHTGVRALLRAWTSQVITNAGQTRSSLALHVPIFEAIERADADAARAAMAHHMTTASRHLAEAVAAQRSLV